MTKIRKDSDYLYRLSKLVFQEQVRVAFNRC